MLGPDLREPPAEDPPRWLGLGGLDTDPPLGHHEVLTEGLSEGVTSAPGLPLVSGWDSTHLPCPLCLFRYVTVFVMTTERSASWWSPRRNSVQSMSSKHLLCVSAQEVPVCKEHTGLCQAQSDCSCFYSVPTVCRAQGNKGNRGVGPRVLVRPEPCGRYRKVTPTEPKGKEEKAS